MGDADRKPKGRARNPQNSGFYSYFPNFTVPWGSEAFRGGPGDVPEGLSLTAANTQHGNAKKTKPPRTGRRRKKAKRKAEPGIRKIPDSILNYAILPVRSAPWSSVGFRGAFRIGGHWG